MRRVTATATHRVTATATRRATATATHRVTATATPLAFMRMLRIGDTGGGTSVDERERSESLVLSEPVSDHLEEDRRRGTIYARASTFLTVVAYH
jgi:hypothetical protein